MTTLNRIVYKINLDMHGTTRRRLITANQGDKATRYIVANLRDDGKEYVIPSGAQTFLNVEKPDGTFVYTSCTFEGSEVTAELKGQTLAVDGIACCNFEIRTSDSSQVATTESFEMVINKSVRDDDAVESSNEMSALQDATANATEATASANDAAEDANEAADNANAAASSANAAATNANEKATAASNAATAANAAATNADTKAAAAQEATDNANAAASSVDNVKTRATEAAEACEGIVAGHNTLIDVVTGVAAVITLEDSILCIREA